MKYFKNNLMLTKLYMYYILIIILLIICIIYFLYRYYNINKNKLNSNITVETVNKQNVETFNKQLTVILCHAEWCSHCPIVKEWFSELVYLSPKQNTKFIMMEEKEIPKDIYNKLEGFPSILILYDNKIVIYSGSRTKKDLLNYLEIL